MSKDGAIERIKCSFSLLDEGRKYTGNHRKYVIENAREICYAPETREKIKLREALGYYGHGGRQIAGRMDLSEVQAVTLPGGTEQVITNIPSNVTVQFDIDKDGTVTHSQDVLDSDTGRIVQGLNKSHVGGFSWACPGEDGGATGKTKLTGFSGFDYVLNPGFAYNRGYVLESAGEADQLIYEAVNAVVRDEKKARAIADSWRLDVPDLREALFESEGDLADAEIKRHELEKTCDRLTSEKSELVLKNTRMSDELAGMQRRFDAATASLLARQTALKNEIENSNRNLRAVVEGLRASAPFFIPENAMHGLMEGDFSKARAIFEQAKHMALTQYPIPGADEHRPHATVPAHPVDRDGDKRAFGSPEWGWNTEV